MKDNKILANSLSIFKCGLVGKILAGFIGVTVSIAATKIGNNAYIIAQVLAIIIYSISFYQVMWRAGFADSNKTNTKINKLSGIICGFIASTPYLLSALAVLILKIINSDVSILWYRIINIEYFSFFALVLPQTNIVSQIQISDILIAFIPLLVVPIIAQISYILGFKKFSLSENIIYKKKNNG